PAWISSFRCHAPALGSRISEYQPRLGTAAVRFFARVISRPNRRTYLLLVGSQVATTVGALGLWLMIWVGFQLNVYDGLRLELDHLLGRLAHRIFDDDGSRNGGNLIPLLPTERNEDLGVTPVCVLHPLCARVV